MVLVLDLLGVRALASGDRAGSLGLLLFVRNHEHLLVSNTHCLGLTVGLLEHLLLLLMSV